MAVFLHVLYDANRQVLKSLECLFTYVFGGHSRTLLAYIVGGRGESALILQVGISCDRAWKPHPSSGLGPNMM